MTEAFARRVIVEGFVQGVGYRDFVRRAALRLGVSGWVRNRADGTVEALISAAPEKLEAMLAAMRDGPPGAEVTNLRLADPGVGENPKARSFTILSTL
jgi:acylphosphatase